MKRSDLFGKKKKHVLSFQRVFLRLQG